MGGRQTRTPETLCRTAGQGRRDDAVGGGLMRSKVVNQDSRQRSCKNNEKEGAGRSRDFLGRWDTVFFGVARHG
jgi:hypothetical protein